jgi:hypothetical protein
MSTTNRRTITMFVAAVAVLIGVGMIANPVQQVNAQGNQTNATNVTGGAAKNATGGEKKVVAAVKIDVDPVMKALKDAYPKLGDVKGEENKSFVEGLKDLKDAKETAKTMVAANLMRDLIQFKALQDMQ